MLVKLFQFASQVIHGAFLELADANPAITVLNHFGFDADGFDLFTDDGDREGTVFVLAVNREQDLGTGFATHTLDGFVQGQAFHGGVVNLGDQVARLQARTVSRRAFNRRDHLDHAVFLGNFDADTDKLACRALTEFFIGFFVEILGMRV